MILKEKKYQDFKKLLNKNVNSFHNYGINKYQLAKNFYPLALSQNYVEAAISLKNKQFGIMWHPEREKIFNQKDIKIFRKFFVHNLILLSAGSGKRLKPYTVTKPKCFINIGGTTLIENLIKTVKKIEIIKNYFSLW